MPDIDLWQTRFRIDCTLQDVQLSPMSIPLQSFPYSYTHNKTRTRCIRVGSCFTTEAITMKRSTIYGYLFPLIDVHIIENKTLHKTRYMCRKKNTTIEL